MYIVMNHLHLDIPIEQVTAKMEKEAIPMISGLPGFIGVYLTRESENRGTVVILWDSLENARNGGAVMGPGWFAQNIAPHLASDQVRTVEEVLVAHPPR